MLPVPGKAPQAVVCLVLVVGLMVSGVVPNVQAALIGCLLMGALGCVDLTSAYRSIDWKTIVLIVGMLPFSIALQRTGGVDLAADGLRALIGGAGPHVVLATLFAITALLGMFISNTATAVLMAPVALAVAKELQRLALSVRDDRRAGRLDGVHDAGLVAGEHAGGHAGQLHVRRLRARRRAVSLDRPGRLRLHGALAAAALTLRRPALDTSSQDCQHEPADRSRRRPSMQKILDVVEKVGNKVPHPVVIFLILIAIVVVLSARPGLTGASVTSR